VPGTASTSTCRHCGAALDAHTRLTGNGHCRAAGCLHREDVARAERLKRRLAVVAVDAAAAQLPALARPEAVVWLEPCATALADVTPEDRARHRRHLETVVADDVVIDRARLAPSTADDSHPQGGHLCGQCRGRCCAQGAGMNAFIDRTVLQRWQDQHPGATADDAVEAYVAALPARHVEGACLYQAERGCALRRDERASICNGYACEPLQQVQRLAARAPRASVVALTWGRDGVERAAAIDAAGARAFEPEPR
jgi:hypothetical protein